MQVLETMLGCFGSRLTLHFLPRQHQIKLSPMGKYYDHAWNFRLGLRLTNVENQQSQLYLLPFTELVNSDEIYFQEIEQELTATSVKFKVHQRNIGLEAKFNFISPFYPKNEKLSTAPFFYLEIELGSKPPNYQVDVIVGLQSEGVEVQPFKLSGCSGVELTDTYQLQDGHWGGQVSDRISSQKFTSPIWIGLIDSQLTKSFVQASSFNERFQLTVPLDPITKSPQLRFILATHIKQPVLDIRGQDFRYKYTEFFQDISEVIQYAVDEAAFVIQRTQLFDSLFLDFSLGKSSSDFMAFTFQSYVPNTWWVISINNPAEDWFSVWEGNCVFHSTVDVEYNLAWFYLCIWPELLEKTLSEWRRYTQTSTLGAVMSHDVGGLLGANQQQYPHLMEVEENTNFILLTYALWRFTGNEAILRDNADTVLKLIELVLNSDSTGNGFPNLGVANTIDDASPAVQFGREQTYLAVKSLAACWATHLLLQFMNDPESLEIANRCKVRSEQIIQTLTDSAWLGDHFAVTLDRDTANLFNPWTGEALPAGELEGWNAYSLYTSNGLLYLLATDPGGINAIPCDLTRFKRDIEASLTHSLIEYGCTHSSQDKSNLWISQNLWRDITAGYLGLDYSNMIDRYWAFEQMENSQGRGGCFIDTYGSNWLHYYPRGIASMGLLSGLCGLKLNTPERIISFAPVRLPLRVPLPIFADWDNGLIPWVEFKLEENVSTTNFENKFLLDGFEIIPV